MPEVYRVHARRHSPVEASELVSTIHDPGRMGDVVAQLILYGFETRSFVHISGGRDVRQRIQDHLKKGQEVQFEEDASFGLALWKSGTDIFGNTLAVAKRWGDYTKFVDKSQMSVTKSNTNFKVLSTSFPKVDWKEEGHDHFLGRQGTLVYEVLFDMEETFNEYEGLMEVYEGWRVILSEEEGPLIHQTSLWTDLSQAVDEFFSYMQQLQGVLPDVLGEKTT